MDIEFIRLCELCSTNFSKIDEYISHQWSLSHHIKKSKSQAGVKDHRCQLCNFACDNLADFAIHLDTSEHKRKVEREIFVANRKLSSPQQPPPSLSSRRSIPLLSNVIFPPPVHEPPWITRPGRDKTYPHPFPPTSRNRNVPLNYQHFRGQPFDSRPSPPNKFLPNSQAVPLFHKYVHQKVGVPSYSWTPSSADQRQSSVTGESSEFNLSNFLTRRKNKKETVSKTVATGSASDSTSETTSSGKKRKNVRIAEPDSTTGASNFGATPEIRDATQKKPHGSSKKKSKVDRFSSSTMKRRQKMIEESISRRLLTQRLKKYQVETPSSVTELLNNVALEQKTHPKPNDSIAYKTVITTNGTVNIVPNRAASPQLICEKENDSTEPVQQSSPSIDSANEIPVFETTKNSEEAKNDNETVKAENESFHALDFLTENCESFAEAAITTETEAYDSTPYHETSSQCTVPSATCQIGIVKHEIVLSDEEENGCSSSSLSSRQLAAVVSSPTNKADVNQAANEHSQKLEKLWNFCKQEEQYRVDIKSMNDEISDLKRRLEEVKRRRNERQKDLDLCQIEKNKLLAEGNATETKSGSLAFPTNPNRTENVSAAHLQYLGIINSQNPIFQSIEMALGLAKNSESSSK